MCTSVNHYRRLLINNIEIIATYLLRKLSNRRGVKKYQNLWRVDGSLINLKECAFLKTNNFKGSHFKSRSALNIYILSEIHRLLLTNCTCTIRELYYKNAKLCRNQQVLNAALLDICNLFHTIPWNFGIFSSGKGLITGPLKMFLKNGEIIDCNVDHDIVLLPKAISVIDHIETTADLVLVVEKDTIFQKLKTQMLVGGNVLNMILITGKGFPDLCTRVLVHRLSNNGVLPTYILVDADPFGINIMQIYKTGSNRMKQFREQLICSEMRWLGVHPSELDTLDIPTLPLTPVDNKKLVDVQKNNVPYAVNKELILLQQIQRKSHIDDLPSRFLLNDYILNKIKRNLSL